MNIDQLSKIKAVEVPPFLLTRILQKIERNSASVLPKAFVRAFSLSFVLLLLLNFGAVFYSLKSDSGKENLIESMNLAPSNSIYK